MKEIKETKTYYLVGGFKFRQKELAERLDEILRKTPNSRICENCEGHGAVLGNGWKYVTDGNGYIAGVEGTTTKIVCTDCNGKGIQVKHEIWK